MNAKKTISHEQSIMILEHLEGKEGLPKEKIAELAEMSIVDLCEVKKDQGFLVSQTFKIRKNLGRPIFSPPSPELEKIYSLFDDLISTLTED